MIRTKKGFTLIEMMIVIAIIALLATIAIPNYVGFRKKAMTSEAKSNLGTLRTLEEAYLSDTQTYIVCAAHPAAVPAATTTTWGAGNANFNTIGFELKGNLRYQYAVAAGAAGIATSFNATAQGDLDGDATLSTFTMTEAGVLTEASPLE